ncbi:MAG: alpha,6-mannosyltransferase [Thermoleophilaceae bacterium]|nr:alpha,6-mannosyltransferase [Thermoleophilaceae bacterium]
MAGTAEALAPATTATATASSSSPGRGLRPGRLALAALCVVYALLAAFPAAPGSRVVLATAGGSPDWLLGPLRPFGLSGASGSSAGPLLFAGMWVALLLYAVVLVRAGDISRRAAIWTVAGLHVLFLLAPPLLSQDVFSYIAYARLGVEHGLSPYTHSPIDIPSDPVFGFAGSKDAVSVYGPAFTLLTYPLSSLGVAGAYWVLKVIAAAASLGVVALVWRTAERLGRDPVAPALFVGLSPLVLVHVVSAAHNEALVVLLTMAGVYAFVRGQPRAAGFWSTFAAGLKASAGLVVPYLVLGSRPRRVLAGVAAAAVLLAVVGLAGFGTDVLHSLGLLSSNQGRSSRLSFPYVVASVVGDRSVVRALFGLAFVAAAVWTLWRTWRGADPIRMAGWATFAILVASAWLVPWYLLWLLPLAALAADRRLAIATVALSGWVLAIGVPGVY